MTEIPQTHSVTDLSFEVQRTPDRIRGDIKSGRLGATKVGLAWRFTIEQFTAAVEHYRELDAAQGIADGVHGT